MTPEFTLLIVDDEANVLKALRRLFFSAPYRVLTADSGAAGLEVFDHEAIDLVISDYRMPTMNGVEFLKRVKEKFPDTIRMILSGFADVSAVVEAINDGAIYKFLAKPWNDQELLSTVRRALDHSTLQHENVALLSELKVANVELRKLATGLDTQVRKRTHDLEQKSRAVSIAHAILNLLPVGVIGIDSDDMIVYMNPQLDRYIDMSRAGLGLNASQALDEQLHSPMREALVQNRQICRTHLGAQNATVICTPLHNRAGVVAMIGFLDASRHSQATSPDGHNGDKQ